MATAYDFKVLLPTLGVMALALTAACKFSGQQSQPGDYQGPKLNLGG